MAPRIRVNRSLATPAAPKLNEAKMISLSDTPTGVA
jgi:hypothetical protein